jgi:hypothetical protein
MKIDPTLLTQKLTEANVHPGFYKMLGLKGPFYRWVKCPLDELRVGDTIKIVKYDEIPKAGDGFPCTPECWNPHMRDQCGKEFKVVTKKESKAASVDMAYVSGVCLYVRHSISFRDYCWHDGCIFRYFNFQECNEDNLFYVRRACES